MNIYLEIIQTSITFAPKFKKRYEPVLNYKIQYAQCCMGQQDLMRPLHSARTLVQRIHLTILQFASYYFALPLPRKGGRDAVYGVSVRKNRTNLCIHPKRKKLMFTIISIMFIGIGIGYLMRNVQMLQKWRKAPRSPSYCCSLYSVYPSVPTV